MSEEEELLVDKEFLKKVKDEPSPDIHISRNYEVITVCWMDTPNWIIHPFFENLNNEAITSSSIDGYQVITIARNVWDAIIAKLLAKKLAVFEEQMLRKGKNTRKEMNEFLSKQLEGIL